MKNALLAMAATVIIFVACGVFESCSRYRQAVADDGMATGCTAMTTQTATKLFSSVSSASRGNYDGSLVSLNPEIESGMTPATINTTTMKVAGAGVQMVDFNGGIKEVFMQCSFAPIVIDGDTYGIEKKRYRIKGKEYSRYTLKAPTPKRSKGTP